MWALAVFLMVGCSHVDSRVKNLENRVGELEANEALRSSTPVEECIAGKSLRDCKRSRKKRNSRKSWRRSAHRSKGPAHSDARRPH